MQKGLKFAEASLIEAVAEWEHSEAEKGQIYTRSELVEYMLTAIGLNNCEDLEAARILEPSCGEGEFVVAITERLINSPKQRPAIE